MSDALLTPLAGFAFSTGDGPEPPRTATQGEPLLPRKNASAP